MSQIVITIATSNAAFQGEEGGYELARILNIVGDTAQDLGAGKELDGMQLYVNGNRVGHIRVKP